MATACNVTITAKIPAKSVASELFVLSTNPLHESSITPCYGTRALAKSMANVSANHLVNPKSG